MRQFNVKSKGFAAPQYPGSNVLTLQVRRATGTKAMIGLVVGFVVMMGGHLYRAFDARPVHGTAECSRQQENYRAWETKNGLPHSFEAEVELCRSEQWR